MIRNSRRVVALAVAGAVAVAPVISGCGAGGEPQTAAPTQLTEGVNVSVPKDKPEAAQVEIRNMFLLGPKPGMSFGQGSSLPLYATVINQVKGRQDRLLNVTSSNFAQPRITGGSVVLPPAQPSGQGSAVRLMGQAAAPSPSPGATDSGKPDKKKTKKPGAEPSGTATAQPSGGATAQPSGGASGQPSGGATPEPTGSGAAPNTTSTPESSNTPSAPATDPSVPVAPPGKAPLVVLTGLNRQLLGGEQVTVRLQFEQAGTVDVTVPVIPQQGEYVAYTAVSAGVPAPGASITAQPSEGTSPGATPGHGATPSHGESVEPGQPGSTSPPATPAAPEGSQEPGTGH
ncbi:hypothetical protein [Actinomadura rubrisoli]|uniref:Copper chaperone PCu(A)C n=1 Tax=Actinomadura rubrisoli TaxID=2530368 RepID=A0A4V2YVC8_9ACTN|nr:hypothetical protein [Actinomadura rubrisoli]TDD80977.1 hypothetical protein E1298_24835 [Actinomadura rubrisoli]